MKKEIKHQFTFPHPPEVVWDYLTKSELLAQWLVPNDFKPIVGHEFQFGAKPKLKIGFDGRIYCKVLEIVPYQKLVYSWKGGMSREKPSLDSIVTWTLSSSEKGTVLSLEHSGFKGFKNYLPYIIMNKGWATNSKKLFKLMELNLIKL